jgi:hypothetical protein
MRRFETEVAAAEDEDAAAGVEFGARRSASRMRA